MPFTFARVSLKHPNIQKPLEYGWLLKIHNLVDLLTFFVEKDWVMRAAVADYFSSIIRNRHFTNPTAQGLSLLCDEDGRGFTQLMGKMNSDRFTAMANNLPLYINRVGGWMPERGCTEHETVVAEKWPESDKIQPRFIQWQGGKHWYVKIGNQDIEVDGQQKWNTKQAAEEAYKKWLDSH